MQLFKKFLEYALSHKHYLIFFLTFTLDKMISNIIYFNIINAKKIYWRETSSFSPVSYNDPYVLNFTVFLWFMKENLPKPIFFKYYFQPLLWLQPGPGSWWEQLKSILQDGTRIFIRRIVPPIALHYKQIQFVTLWHWAFHRAFTHCSLSLFHSSDLK